MSWVRENVATEGQNVRGIIVASEVDDALRYAAKGLPNLSVKTYTVTFSLQSEDTAADSCPQRGRLSRDTSVA
jgi:hypothetical protein